MADRKQEPWMSHFCWDWWQKHLAVRGIRESLVQLLNHALFFATPWTAACQASLSITNSWNLFKLMSMELVMPPNHLILCCPLLHLPSIFPSTRVFTKESVLHIRWPKFWSFSLRISPSNEYSGLISFRIKTTYPPEMLRGFKQNLVHTRTQRPHRDWARPDFEWLSVSCGGTGQQWPATETGALAEADLGGTPCDVKSSWRRSPLAPPQSHQADDSQTGKHLYQRISHIVIKVLGPTADFPTWGSHKGTENPQRIWLWMPVGFDYKPSTGLGKQTLGEHKQNLVHTRTQEKRAVTPQQTEPDLPVSVRESLVEAWVDSGLPWGQGHWIQQC